MKTRLFVFIALTLPFVFILGAYGQTLSMDTIFNLSFDRPTESLKVNVVAGGAGGGLAQTQVRNATDTLWTNVGLATSLAKMPVRIFDAAGDSLEDAVNNAVRVNVVAGGAGGGLSQLQVRDGTNNWTDIGYFAGNLNVPIQGTVTANAGTGTFNVDIQDASLPVTQSGAWTVAGSGTFTVGGTVTANAGTGTFNVDIQDTSLPVTQSGAWTVTANAGSGTFTVGGTVTANQGTPTTAANAWPVKFTDGSNLITAGDNANNAVRVNVVAGGAGGGAAQLQVRNSGDTAWVNIGVGAESASVLKVPVRLHDASGNIAAILNAAPTTEYGLVTRNIPSGTQTVDGTVTANQGGAWTVAGSGTFTVGGTVTANAGTGTFTVGGTVTANAGTGTFNVDIQDASLPVTQSGAWTVAGTGTFTVGGTVTSNQGTAAAHANRWPVGISDGAAFISPSTDRTTAAAPFSTRLSDGSAFYDAAKTGQLPSALVGGRLDANIGAWLGSTAPTVGQKTSANSIPVVQSSNFVYCDTIIAVNQTTSTSVIAGVASEKIFICSIMLISASAQNLSITTGTGSVCATGEDAVIGGTTPSLAVAANGGFSMVSSTPFLVTKDAADGLCVEQSGAGNVSGTITYKQQVP